jgi:hypothetical protein
LTSQLLAFSRRQPVSPRAESLCTLVADLEKMLRRIIGEDVHLQTNTDVECDLVMIDRGVFEHVLLNLAVNARDAMPKGGTLYIGCSNETLEAAAVDAGDRALPPGRYVRLRVRDDGVGMTEETQAHMFEPFFTTKQLGRGTGLGLSTVYGIVSQASGFIRVSSGVGAGTTIDIYLPPSADGTSRTVRPPGTASLRGSERILVVEDDDQVRAITQRALEHFGYQVVTASRAAEALAIVADDSSFDLILTDLVMPDMSGAELAEHLSETLGVRVLFMTGYAPESVAERGIVAAGEVLRKPFSRIELGERVRALLDDQA